MASIRKRRNDDGTTSWDTLVRVTSYPTESKTFRSKLAAELWATKREAAARGAPRRPIAA